MYCLSAQRAGKTALGVKDCSKSLGVIANLSLSASFVLIELRNLRIKDFDDENLY